MPRGQELTPSRFGVGGTGRGGSPGETGSRPGRCANGREAFAREMTPFDFKAPRRVDRVVAPGERLSARTRGWVRLHFLIRPRQGVGGISGTLERLSNSAGPYPGPETRSGEPSSPGLACKGARGRRAAVPSAFSGRLREYPIFQIESPPFAWWRFPLGTLLQSTGFIPP